MLSILDAYIIYLKKNPLSMLARIYAIYTIKTNYFDPVSLILMQNTCMNTSK